MGALDRRHAGTEYGKCQGCGEEGYETLLFLPHEEFHPPCDPGSGKALGLTHIYAVTNYGYYANNHVRRDRKLKTSFSDFWEESGGHPCEDRRFYELPMTEYRKAMEEVPAHKRNYYRKRYALLDEVDASIAENIKALSK